MILSEPADMHPSRAREQTMMVPDATPQFRGPFAPVHPCREMPTRHCPAVYGDVCGTRPCARFQADENDPDVRAAWLAEIETRPLR